MDPCYLKNGSTYQNVPSKKIIENLKIHKFDIIHFFDIWNGFWDISKKKTVFEKTLSDATVS